jgi:CBS domain-containing protein
MLLSQVGGASVASGPAPGIGETRRRECGFPADLLRVHADSPARRALHDQGMNVESIMSTQVVTVAPSTPLKEVARLLVEHRVSGLPVVDVDGAVVGVVSEQDIVSKERGVSPPARHAYEWLFGPAERDPQRRVARTVSDAMTSPAVVVSPLASVAGAARLMVERSVSRLPVVHEGALVGIVTRADLVRVFTRDDAELEREIREDVVRHTLWITPRHLDVRVRDGEVVLAGEVETRTEAELIGAYAARVPGVVSVDDSRLRWLEDDLARRRWQTLPRRA